ncbi:MAG: type II toxin-antitoxin system VapC family toxin [Betaproteobacteria bacterium]|nr:type II toxin-antitoxin system VapC family toxin [Betaproteobacteria bacterium]
MKLLLDTCTFLWLIWDEPELQLQARDVIRDPDHEVFLSPVSVWEALVKHRIGKLQLKTAEPAWQHFASQREAHGVETLAVDEASVAHVSRLPDFHRDPFDRLLICQAIEHGLTIVTPDPLIRRYPVRTLW